MDFRSANDDDTDRDVLRAAAARREQFECRGARMARLTSGNSRCSYRRQIMNMDGSRSRIARPTSVVTIDRSSFGDLREMDP